MWTGAAKFAKNGHVAMNTVTVTNLGRHGCRDHSPDDPPLGRGSTISLPRWQPGAGCTDGNLVSWIAPSAGGGSFYGYRGRGHTDEFWILEVEGTLVVIEANWSPGSSEAGLAELRAILDSIRVEP